MSGGAAGARPRRATRGAVYVEFLIAFMPLLVFFLCLWQVAILYGTKLFVDHAAFSGARAAAVVIAESANRVQDNGGASSVNTLDGRRNRLVQDAVALSLLPLILDGTVISFNVQYPDGATPGGPNVMLGQKYPGMGNSTVTMARVRVRAMMNCKIAFANMVMCNGLAAKIGGLVGAGTIFPPYIYVKSEAIFPYQGVNYTYDANDDSGNSPSSLEDSPLAAQNISGCFVAGTPVETIDGARPIEAIQAGDLVLTRDVETEALSYGRVVGTSVVVDKPVVDVQLAETETIRATPNHLFWTADRGWVPAGDLVAGETLSSARFGELHVVAVEPEAERSTVFNFEVDETHTYYVGEAEALVHNAQVCSNDGGAGDGGAGGGRNASGGINIGAAALQHAIDRHTPGGKSNKNASTFDASENLTSLINAAAGQTPMPAKFGNYATVVNAGRDIGTDRDTGMPTQVYTVITDANGNLVTIHPGNPTK